MTSEAFFAQYAPTLPANWTNEQKASELGMYALEGLAVLPELDIGQGSGVPQEVFDREVEEAYEFYRGEALVYLSRNRV